MRGGDCQRRGGFCRGGFAGDREVMRRASFFTLALCTRILGRLRLARRSALVVGSVRCFMPGVQKVFRRVLSQWSR